MTFEQSDLSSFRFCPCTRRGGHFCFIATISDWENIFAALILRYWGHFVRRKCFPWWTARLRQRLGPQRSSGCLQVRLVWEISTHPIMIRIFGYNRAVARTNSHFGGVEEGTEFAISDLRFVRCQRCQRSNWLVLPGARETSPTYSIVLTQLFGRAASLKWPGSLAFRMKVIISSNIICHWF